MKQRTRKPTHPGKILDELYIKPLGLTLQLVAEHLGISRNTLFKIRSGKASITSTLAVRLAEAFNTTPKMWLNLQQNYDIWCALTTKRHKKIIPLYPRESDCVKYPKAMGE